MNSYHREEGIGEKIREGFSAEERRVAERDRSNLF